MSNVVNLAGRVPIAVNVLAWWFWQGLQASASSMALSTLSVVSNGNRLRLFKAREESR